MSEEEYHNLDVSQGGYPCIIQMAKDLVSGSSSQPAKNQLSIKHLIADDDEEEEEEEEEEQQCDNDAQKDENDTDFCGVNMIWECHIHNKNIPVLSASIVGNFAAKVAGMDDDVVKMMVFKQLEKVYASTVKYQHEVLGNTNFPTTIPQPVWSRVTHWAENNTIQQSYSLITDCQYSTEQRITLAADSHIYLAGEALHLEHGGSVHGAIFSADYALEQIVEKYVK
eukprot:UN02604